jgi:hypothetical protein
MPEIDTDNVSYRKIDDEYFILTVPDAVMHNVTGSGVFIFDQLIEGRDEKEILKALLDEYEVTPAEAEEDLKGFLGQMKELGILNE